jgi:hypothetical protein
VRRRAGLLVVGAVALGAAALALAPMAARAQAGRGLRAPSAFAGIRDPGARSAALFVEAGKVLQHPRCLNCHPDGDRPSQGDGHPHQPAVQRGPDGLGVTAMRCATCHQAANFEPGRVPGNPKWRLAPAEMAWQKRSLAQLCAQIKDPARNGGHSLAEIVAHMAKDELVGWAWKPGADRAPAPGTQATFGALVKAWADSGAGCPTP